MPLTDLSIRNAKPGAKTVRLADSGGLYLEIAPAGGKWWRLKYRFDGKEKRLALGVYPDVPLKGYKHPKTGEWIDGARDKRETAKGLLAKGIDPGLARRAAKTASAKEGSASFEVIAREWFEKFSVHWVEAHSSKILGRLERDIFPWFGRKDLLSVDAPLLLETLRRVESRGAVETAHRELQYCSQVFRYAIATGRAARDPAADLKGALAPHKEKHHASLTDPKAVGALLRAIEGYEGTLIVKCALRLAPLLFVRPGELRHAEWSEFDLKKAEWRIPAAKMKAREQHLVPLSTQSIAILQELYPLTGRDGDGKYVFPSTRSHDRPMSENTVNAALRRLGYTTKEMTGHGFRSMASTLLNEQGYSRDAIERQLAHGERNTVRAAYNYAEHLPVRRKMMQDWANYLSAL